MEIIFDSFLFVQYVNNANGNDEEYIIYECDFKNGIGYNTISSHCKTLFDTLLTYLKLQDTDIITKQEFVNNINVQLYVAASCFDKFAMYNNEITYYEFERFILSLSSLDINNIMNCMNCKNNPLHIDVPRESTSVSVAIQCPSPYSINSVSKSITDIYIEEKADNNLCCCNFFKRKNETKTYPTIIDILDNDFTINK